MGVSMDNKHSFEHMGIAMLAISSIDDIKNIKVGEILCNPAYYGDNHPVLVLAIGNNFYDHYRFEGIWLSNDEYWLARAAFSIGANSKDWFKIC